MGKIVVVRFFFCWVYVFVSSRVNICNVIAPFSLLDRFQLVYLCSILSKTKKRHIHCLLNYVSKTTP